MESFIAFSVVLLVVGYAGYLIGRDTKKSKIYPGVYKNIGIIPAGEKTIVAIKNELCDIESYIIPSDKVPPIGMFRVTEEGTYVKIDEKK